MKRYSISFIAFFALLLSPLFAQDPSWHKIPKDDLMGNRGEIARKLQSDATEQECLDIMKRTETDEPVLYLKMLACKRLATHGTEAAVPILVSQMDEDIPGFYARYALETIPSEKVDVALCEILPTLKNPKAIAGVLTTLGVRANPKTAEKSAEIAQKFLSHENRDVSVAAGYSLAACCDAGNKKAIEFFSQKNLDRKFADSASLLAETLFKSGNQESALAVYKALSASDVFPYQKEAAVYREILARGNDGISLLVEKLRSDSPQDFAVALKASRELPAGASVTKAMIDELQKLSIPKQALLILAIGDRVDNESRKLSLPVLSMMAQYGTTIIISKPGQFEGRDTIRVAAIQALRNVGDASILPVLIAAANETDSADVSSSAKKTLEELAGSEVDAAIVNLAKTSDSAQVKSLAIDLIKERRIVAAFQFLKEALNDSDSAVQKSALDAVAQIATIDDLPMLLKLRESAKSPEEIAGLEHVLKSACTRMSQNAAAEEVAKFFGSDSIQMKCFLLELLKEIGGEAALNQVDKHIWGNDAELADKATEVLGQWRSPKDVDILIPICFKVAKDSPFKIRGLRAAVRLARQFEMPEDNKIAICNKVFEMADRNEDKILVFDV
ncbi:MAG: HEAT repeat domain-containing protein, partial [Thermoguttaceae bacterium]